MTLMARLRSFLSALLSSRRLEREMAEEWQFHLDERADALAAAGLARADAERQARLEFGDTLRWTEQGREARGLRWIQDVRADTHYALRQFRRTPGFTAVAVVTLALGIGATSAIFSVVYGVLLRSLPYNDADRLVWILQRVAAAEGVFGGQFPVPIDMSELNTFRMETQTLSHVGAYGTTTLTLTGQGDAMRFDGAMMSADLLPMLGIAPLLGRSFDRGEDAPGADAVVILGYGMWQRQFGGDPHVIGRVVSLDGRDRTIVGVMPPRFSFPDTQTQFWIPYVVPPRDRGLAPRVPMIARVKKDVTLQAAAAEVTTLLRRLAPAPPPPPPPPGVTAPAPRPAPVQEIDLVSVQESLVAPTRPALLMLAAAVGFVLLIACLNVANLLLARTAARRRELAVRLALGAGRGRLVRQLLTESVLLALVGGIAGIALAYGGVRLLQVLGATLSRRDLGSFFSIPRLGEIAIDPPVLLFTVAVSALTGVLFGLAPALRQSHGHSIEILRDGSASASSGFDLLGRHRMQGLLVITEIAMAMLLLVGGGLLIRSFVKLSSVDPGYDPTNVLTFQVGLPGSGNSATFAEALVERLRTIPGVRSAGYARQLPMVRARSTLAVRRTPEPPRVPPPPPAAPGVVNPPEWPDARHVSRDFLAVMGIRVIAGRPFGDSDGAGQPQVLLINRTLARSGLLGDHPIGQRVYAMGMAPWEIIGIVDDVRQFGLDQQPGPQVFVDIRQLYGPNAARIGGPTYFAVRTMGDPAAAATAIRGVVSRLDPTATVDNVATMEQLLSNSVVRPRLYAVLLGMFAALAATLAAVGIYGVMAYAVTERTREIGIRVALGARRSDVMTLVLGQGALLTAIGIALGVFGAAAVTGYLRTMLFGLTPLDPPTFIAVSVAFAAVALLATCVPARRATRVDPIVALRCE
jgi:putative ABC transport system permease protein